MEEKVLLLEDFVPHGYGSYKTNIPNVWTTAYYYQVPNGLICRLDTKPFYLKITAYESFTVNTTQDFIVSVSHNVATVRNPKSNQIEYEWMAVARGRTSGGIVHATGYSPSTKSLTFPAIGGGEETVDVFYLVADGLMRLQITAPARAQSITQSIFEASLDSVNSTRQTNVNQFLRIPADFELRPGWKLELAVNSPASIILSATDIPDPATYNWNDIALVMIPILIGKE